MFLSTFLFRITIIHKLNKIHQNIDDLFCLFIENKKKTFMFVIKVLNKSEFFDNICFKLTIDFIFDKIAT